MLSFIETVQCMKLVMSYSTHELDWVSAVVSRTVFIFIIFCKINELYVLQTNQVYKLNKKYIGMNN